MKRLLQAIAIRYPCALASTLFIAVMALVKLGAARIVENFGVIGALVTIAAIVAFANTLDRR
jgi:hypothetical protein